MTRNQKRVWLLLGCVALAVALFILWTVPIDALRLGIKVSIGEWLGQ